MVRIVSRHRFVSLLVVLIVLSAGILFKTQRAQAFTLVNSAIIFDPVSLFSDQEVHVHALNQLGSGRFDTLVSCRPTSAHLGTPISTARVTLNPGEGFDQIIAFRAFAPPPGIDRIPITCAIVLFPIPPATTVPFDFSGRLISSLEIVDNTTGKQQLILGSRHILSMPIGPCLFCN